MDNQSLREQLVRAQRLATVGTMAAMVAHEFNNILVPVASYAQLAAGGNEVLRDKAIRHALEGSNRAASICRALLDLTGTAGEAPRTVTLVQLVDETLAAMARDLGKDGIVLVKKIPPGLKLVTQPALLKQVILNLLLNARSAVLAKGRGQSISLSASRTGGALLIRVADTGVGIPPENLGRIFEPFFTTASGGKGTGLGLAICRTLAESLGGALSVRSQVGKGTCFTLRLKAATADRSAIAGS